MFRFICKYTPFLKRGFICVLTLLLLVSCFVKPVSVKAIAFADPATAALLSWYIGSGFISDSMEDLAAVLAEFIGKLKSGFSDIYDQDYTLQFLLDLAKYGNRSSFVLRENESKLLKSLAMLIINKGLLYGKISHKDVDLEKDDLKEEEIPFVEHDVPLYVPNEVYLQNALTIEQAQVLYKGFETGMAALSADLSYQFQLLNISLGHRMQLLREYIHDMNDYLGWKIEDVGQILKNTRSQLSTDITDLRESLASKIAHLDQVVVNFRTQVNDSIEHLEQVVVNFRIQVNDSIVLLKNTFNSRLVELKTSVEALPKQLGNVISDQFDSLQLSIEHLTETFPALQQRLDQILEKIPVYEDIEIIKKPVIFEDSMLQAGLVEDSLINNTNDGKDNTIVIIGQGKDLITKYRSAFLAIGFVLTKFLSVPVIGDLVLFGFALGIFALLVNLGNTIVSKSSGSSAKSNYNIKLKGG